ncbi:MAG TPA: type VI secretion system contractile sheath large subunit [Acidobacteriota bacterium]|nr:type VI secretion system contractile sheath large subunit [Acidobacteriota bacterium]
MGTLLEQLAEKAKSHTPALPLKLLVVADCAGRDCDDGPLEVRASGVGGLIERLRPAARLSIENRLQKGGAKLTLDLEFRKLDDFHPRALLSRSEILAEAAQEGHPALADQLDEIVHHTEFQKQEAMWLGLDRVWRTIDGSASIRLEVLPANRKNLQERFHRLVFEPEFDGKTATPLSAVFFDFRFSHEPADLSLLVALAADCAALQCPMIAAVHPGFFQLKNLVHLPSLADIAGRLQLPVYAGWRKFQTDPASRWACLTANRFLAREPHALAAGADFPVEYHERADAAHPEKYLWADAGWLVLCNLVRSFSRYHHCVILDGMGPETAHAGLPVRPFPKKANVLVPSPTEILIDDDKAWEIVRAGITMLVGISDGAVATFPFLTDVYRLKPGVMTTESALSYQIFAGRLAHYLMELYPQLPPVDSNPEGTIEFLRERLGAFLVPFLADKPEESVQLELTDTGGESKGKVLNIRLKPVLRMQGKEVDFTLQLAF